MANTARGAALRMLALRRLTEAQLWKKLEARGFGDDAIAQAIADCKHAGYLDDNLFATLYVEGPRKAVGDARLVAELVKRGIDREAAQRAVSDAPTDQAERIARAYAKLLHTKRDLSYQAAARALERLGFPTSLIYRQLREHAAAAFAEMLVPDGCRSGPGLDDCRSGPGLDGCPSGLGPDDYRSGLGPDRAGTGSV